MIHHSNIKNNAMEPYLEGGEKEIQKLTFVRF